MPIVDRRTNSVVLRIVYDGPPEAGKTTNLRHLCERLSLSRRGQLESPGGGDRTQFFDWLDVTGGWVGGHRVRCQLVTVPGQIQLARRRRHILDSADVIVLVADSRPRAAPETNAALRSLVRGLGSRADVPLVLQANKQDLAEAQPPEALRALLGLAARVPVVAAHAVGGAGVVETFMLAVRLAVDHVRALLVAGELDEGDPSSAADLLRALEADAPAAFDALDAIARAAEVPAEAALPASIAGHAAAAPDALAVAGAAGDGPPASSVLDIAGVPVIAARNTPTRPIRPTRRSRMNLTEAAAAAVDAVNQALRTGAAEVHASSSGPIAPPSAELHASPSGPMADVSTGAAASLEAAAPHAEHAAAPPIRIVRCAPVRAAMMSRLESPISARTTTIRGTGRGGPDSGASAADAAGRVTSEEPTRPIRIIRGAPVRVTRTGAGAATDAALHPPHDPAPVVADRKSTMPMLASVSAPSPGTDAASSTAPAAAAPTGMPDPGSDAASPTPRAPVVALHGAPSPGANADAASAAPSHVPAPVLAMHPAPGVAAPSGAPAPRARPSEPGPFMAMGTAPFTISPAPRSLSPGDPEPTATGTASFPAAAPGPVSNPAPSPLTVAASVLSRPPSAPEGTGALGAALFTISGPRASALPPPPAAAAALAPTGAPVRAAPPDDDATTQERPPLAAPTSAGGLVAIGEPIVEIIAEFVDPEPVEPPRRRSPAIAIVAAALASPWRVETVTAEVTVPESVSGDAVTVEIVAVEAITVERPAVDLASAAIRRTRPLPEPQVSRFPGPLVPFSGTDEDTTWEMPAVEAPPPPPVPRREPAPGPYTAADAAAATESAALAATAATGATDIASMLAATGTMDIASMLAATGAAELAPMPASIADASTPSPPSEPVSVALGAPAATDATDIATGATELASMLAATGATDIASMLAATGAAELAPTPASIADASTPNPRSEPVSVVLGAPAAPDATDIGSMLAATGATDTASMLAATGAAELAPTPASIADASTPNPRSEPAATTERITVLEAALQAVAAETTTVGAAETEADAAAAADVIAALPYPLPPVDLAAGLVWPAVSGRAALAALGTPRRLVDPPAPWAPAGAIELECGDGWLAHSSGELLFSDLDQARPALFEVARWQAKLGPLTPPGRTYALSPEPNGVRMWVLTPSHRTAWVAIEEAFARGDRLTAARLARTGLEAVDEIRARGVAIVDLDHIAADEPSRLLATPWTPDRDRLIAQLQRLFAAAVL